MQSICHATVTAGGVHAEASLSSLSALAGHLVPGDVTQWHLSCRLTGPGTATVVLSQASLGGLLVIDSLDGDLTRSETGDIVVVCGPNGAGSGTIRLRAAQADPAGIAFPSLTVGYEHGPTRTRSRPVTRQWFRVLTPAPPPRLIRVAPGATVRIDLAEGLPDNMTLTGISPGAHGTLDQGFPAAILYTPAPGFTGYDILHYQVDGPFGGQSAPITVHVTEPDSYPRLTSPRRSDPAQLTLWHDTDIQGTYPRPPKTAPPTPPALYAPSRAVPYSQDIELTTDPRTRQLVLHVDGKRRTAKRTRSTQWAWNPGLRLAAGIHHIKATALTAGAKSAAYEADLRVLPAVCTPSQDAVCTPRPRLCGTASPDGRRVTLLLNGEQIAQPAINPAGVWWYSPSRDLPPGPYELTVRHRSGHEEPVLRAFTVAEASHRPLLVNPKRDTLPYYDEISGLAIDGSTHIQVTVDHATVTIPVEKIGWWALTPRNAPALFTVLNQEGAHTLHATTSTTAGQSAPTVKALHTGHASP